MLHFIFKGIHDGAMYGSAVVILFIIEISDIGISLWTIFYCKTVCDLSSELYFQLFNNMNDIIAELAVKTIETENMLQSNIVTIFFGIRSFFRPMP